MRRFNPQQLEAATATEGRILVLAGAGSGKTSVLVERCIHLVETCNISPDAILALTFTNKAAGEMRSRVARKLGKEKAEKITLSTFHSFCYSLLKNEIHHLGYAASFSIYQERELKRLLEQIAPYALEKTEGLSKDALYEMAKRPKSREDEKLKRFLSETMKAHNALDFDDLLEVTLQLFENFPHVLSVYQQRYRYIMIDEYQDTNRIQYELAEKLAHRHGNLFVVGDDDQSIYAFRGSDIRLILEFPHTSLIKLEQNYRSTPGILAIANHVIEKNPNRHGKTLRTAQIDPNLPHLFVAPTEEDEAKAVVLRILKLKEEKCLDWSDFAILYRSNTLARIFEVELLNAHRKEGDRFVRGIPYEVVQWTEFYERAEVKDLLAYLRMFHNPCDETAILRIINYPRRGISPDALKKITERQRSHHERLLHTLRHLPDSLSSAAKAGAAGFIRLIEEGQNTFKTRPLADAIRWLIHTIELQECLRQENKDDKMFQFKWQNVQAFVELAKTSGTNDLGEFLGGCMLDRLHKQNAGGERDRVQLLTFHSAKGLEFSACFLTCLEDELLPHEKSREEGTLEEERRLFYVAITRAKRYLTLSMAQKRKKYGAMKATNPSRFLFDIPKHCLEIEPFDRPHTFL